MLSYKHMETKNEKKKVPERKAIFVSSSIYDRFKKMAEKDGRKYGAYLEVLMDNMKKKA